jgi:glyoxylase-like metal-dependent hydrolase (beta-lactamase superfamily II)
MPLDFAIIRTHKIEFASHLSRPMSWSRLFNAMFFCAALLSAALLCAPCHADEDGGLEKLAEGVYARIVSADGNAVANAGFVVLDRSVLVFDTHFTPEAGRDLLEAIRSVTPKPVRYVVNSHWHADHTHGNQVFADADLIGSVRTRDGVLQNDLPSLERTIGIAQKQLERLDQAYKKEQNSARAHELQDQIKPRRDYLRTVSRLHIREPVVALEDSLVIRDGEREVRLVYLGAGHTNGDIVLLLPSLKIAFVGDLFFNRAIPNVQDGDILQWMQTLEKVLRLDVKTFVPGHGAVGSRKDVEAFLDYFRDLRSLVQNAIDRGDSIEQATQDIRVPEMYSSYQFQNLFPANVQKIYTELKALQLLEEAEEDQEQSTRPDAGDNSRI